ncbi:MAG: hypothetical protein KGZ68_16820 [Dechloromonas sp.]|nr:hypothetical protein [Dechloromonas sp.]
MSEPKKPEGVGEDREVMYVVCMGGNSAAVGSDSPEFIVPLQDYAGLCASAGPKIGESRWVADIGQSNGYIFRRRLGPWDLRALRKKRGGKKRKAS